MTRREKHLSVLAIYLADLERRYDKEFERLEQHQTNDNCRVLIDLYHRIEEVKKEIDELNS